MSISRRSARVGLAQHNAEVAELADAHGSGPCTRKGVGVRVPSSAPFLDFSVCSGIWTTAVQIFLLLGLGYRTWNSGETEAGSLPLTFRLDVYVLYGNIFMYG